MSQQAAKVEQDLDFVRRAVRRDTGPFPRPIALLWAAVSVVGFAWVDVAPASAGLFWMVAGPAGFLLSLWLGMRAARAAGERDHGEGARWAAHWAGLLAAVALAALARGAGLMSWSGFGATILLLIAVAYFTAGVHLHRSLLPVAAILAAGYLAVLYLPGGRTWTVLGVAVAAALVAAAFAGRRRSAPSS